jgi:hypothetical protein
LLSHIGMTQLSAIEKPTISANDFYWRTAANICGSRDVIPWGGKDPQSLLMGFSIVKTRRSLRLDWRSTRLPCLVRLL